MEVEQQAQLIQWKAKLLSQFDTAPLVDKQTKLENELEILLREEAEFKKANVGYIGTDCAEVKRIEAQLTAIAQGSNAEQRRAWVARQQTENEELKAALEKNRQVMFQLDDRRIQLDMLKTRLTAVGRLIDLKTAQIRFLGG